MITRFWTGLLCSLLAACPADPPPSNTDHPPGDSGLTSSGVSTGTPSTYGTGEPTARPQANVGPWLHLTGDEPEDNAGQTVLVSDFNGDGTEEAWVSESWVGGHSYPPYTLHSAMHVLEGVPVEGTLASAATGSITGHPGHDLFGLWTAALPAVGQVVAMVSHPSEEFLFFDGPSLFSGSDLTAADADGVLAHGQEGFRWALGQSVSPCATATGSPAVCVTGTHALDSWPGIVLLFDAPVLGLNAVEDYRARYDGDAGDHARTVANGDLDGDGNQDLLIGAYIRGGYGTVAVLYQPPDGQHRIWDVADATVDGVDLGWEFGLTMRTGDLDGDGYDDAVIGAPFGVGATYGFRGPLAGNLTASSADWTFRGTSDAQWFGYAADLLDVDGDGAMDLAVGSPFSVSNPTAPAGEVALFVAPAPGTHLDQDADITLGSGLGHPDAFGRSVRAGDLDGDGLDDLVVGASRDSSYAQNAGGVFLIYGREL